MDIHVISTAVGAADIGANHTLDKAIAIQTTHFLAMIRSPSDRNFQFDVHTRRQSTPAIRR
jgi:hypothetical protein